jgi:hypothetical protein
MAAAVLPVTGDADADRLLVSDPFKLLVGMLLDQQVPMEWAFRPATLRTDSVTSTSGHRGDAGRDFEDVMPEPSNPNAAWPELTLASWEDTRATFHMWTQIVGKIRLALEPMVNHWWQVPLYVSARGLTTSLMHAGTTGLEIEFDFVEHVLHLRASNGRTRQVVLEPRSVADIDSPEALPRVRAFKQAKKAQGKSKAG